LATQCYSQTEKGHGWLLTHSSPKDLDIQAKPFQTASESGEKRMKTTMQINYDSKAEEWIAFQKKEGKPFLAYAPTLGEAMSLIFAMIQEDKNDHSIPQKSS
jgi:hypothetical protein